MPSQGHAPQPDSVGTTSTNPLFADVIVPRHLNRTFTYRIPAQWRQQAHVGSLVQVPLGASTVQGIIVAVSDAAPLLSPDIRTRPLPPLRDLLAVSDSSTGLAIPPDILELTRQVSEYYLAPWGQCVRFLLSALAGTQRRSRTSRPSLDDDHVTDAAPPIVSITAPAPPWWLQFQGALHENRHAAFLVKGARAYRWGTMMQAVEAATDRKKTVLILSPEISRSAELAALARLRWGERVEEWHSHLTPPARTRAWQRIQQGHADIVIGTRSAVFVPLHSPGLICVDDEDDASFKEEQEPHYHARHVAWMRAQQHGAALLLGTAHPSLETWQRFETVQASEPVIGQHAAVTLVDLRRIPRRTLLSDPMIAGIRTALEHRQGVMLFVNRKGFASALHCRDCGASLPCPRCSVSLTLYRRGNRLACRYCGAARAIPDVCPVCRSSRLEAVGSGTERLEEELRRVFPDVRMARLDRDTARTDEQARRMRHGLATGRVDVLIGTQLLFQGEPMPPVGFVGVPSADAGLHRPDFRSAERTYHTLRDAVATARTDGQVIIQTALPDHHVLASLASDDPAQFYEQELTFRRALGYPPFSFLIDLCVSGKIERTVHAAADRWAAALKTSGHRAADTITVLGPIPASIERVRGRHRRQILVKSTDEARARQSVRATRDAMEAGKDARGLKFDVDVDPVELG